ncbi:unnamed protein product [Adineta ricciae]|uniref:CDV3-like protein n=1 Tax=Adineta ricciae TaxID=249248 RepID=A0A814EC88_ADIRI|nr:unnamed protein product [Adineta ricciae]
MASDNDLDNFFKKKDRKTNKHKKQAGLLTNNEELFKQLVIVTEATTLFKETMDLDDDTLDQQVLNEDITVGTGYTEDAPKHHKTKLPDTNKHSYEQKSTAVSKTTDGQQHQQQQQQDEWEEFEASKSKIEELRLKINGGRDADESDKDDDDYDEDNPNNNDNDAAANREKQKDRPVWRINDTKVEERQQQHPEPVVEQKVEEPKPAQPSTGAYRPPQLRGGSSVTVVGGVNSRVTKKKEPNLASADEFPTLKSTANKK